MKQERKNTELVSLETYEQKLKRAYQEQETCKLVKPEQSHSERDSDYGCLTNSYTRRLSFEQTHEAYDFLHSSCIHHKSHSKHHIL